MTAHGLSETPSMTKEQVEWMREQMWPIGILPQQLVNGLCDLALSALTAAEEVEETQPPAYHFASSDFERWQLCIEWGRAQQAECTLLRARLAEVKAEVASVCAIEGVESLRDLTAKLNGYNERLSAAERERDEARERFRKCNEEREHQTTLAARLTVPEDVLRTARFVEADPPSECYSQEQAGRMARFILALARTEPGTKEKP